MAELLDWRRVEDVSVFGRSLALALQRGYVVAFPTETTYVAAASALCDEATERLLDIGDRPVEIAIADREVLTDWLPEVGSAGRRLARRLWPGPLTLVSREGVEQGLATRLLPGIREHLQPGGALYLRQPAHEALRETACYLAGPLAMRPISTAQGEAVTARHALESAGDRCNLIIDDGICRHRAPATVVEVHGDNWKVIRPGVLTEEVIREQLATLIVFVCTGNTCRSPLAEALCKKALADRLGCPVEELLDRGYRVLSAGMAAAGGMTAAAEAVAVAKALGADLSQHASRQLTADLASQADHVLVMTQGHLHALMQHLPGLAQARLLSPQGDDVDDPIGQSHAVYEACARQMMAYVESLVEAVLGSRP